MNDPGDLLGWGYVAGFVFYCITAPEQGKNQHRSCIFPISATQSIHIHHWMYLLALLPFAIYNSLFRVTGFCVGGIVQSFACYDDYFEIIIPRESATVQSEQQQQVDDNPV